MSQKIAIIGAGGFSAQVLDILHACNRLELRYEMLGYIVEPMYGKPGVEVDGFPILGDFDWFSSYHEEVVAISSTGAPDLRFRLVERAKKWSVGFCNVVHPKAILAPHVSIGEDVVVHAGCHLSFRLHIGNHVHVNVFCAIGENTVLGDFVTLAPGVMIGGNVTIGMGASIGMGSNIIEKVHIGEWSVIGAGSTIVRDVPPNTTVVGVPGKVIKTREVGWHLNKP